MFSGIEAACNKVKEEAFVCAEDNPKIIAAEIMSYLQLRPLASDSLDGIAHWWLVQQAIVKKIDLVEQALEKLTNDGKVLKIMKANRETIYSLNPAYKNTTGIVD